MTQRKNPWLNHHYIQVGMTLLISFLISFAIAFTIYFTSSSIMGYKTLGKPTASFFVLVVAIWLFSLLMIKRYMRLRAGSKAEHLRAQWLQGFVLVILVLAALIGCSALAGLFTRMLYFSVGAEPGQFPLLSQGINALLWVLLLLLVGHYLRYGHLTKTVNLLAAVIQVLENIAKGNYKARLEGELGSNGSLKNLVKSVNNMAADLEQLENMRQEFISNVSHEIQSPLASIRGFAVVLQNEQPLSIEERQLYLGIIEAESLRLSKLSESLLQLAVLDSENLMLEQAPYRLDKQLRNLILACEPQWRAKHIAVEAELEETLCTLDEQRMSQVWVNLIHNAIKFTPEHGHIRVELHSQEKGVTVEISDSGKGIPEEHIQRIFERFYKSDPSRERTNQGSGLGLSIAKKIVDLHGGRISVKSQINKGTAFTVFLPYEQ